MTLNFAARDPQTRDTTPVVLTSGTVPLQLTTSAGPAFAPGAPVNLPTQDLINTLRAPIEVTELHFVATETSNGAGVAGYLSNGIELSIAIGKHLIAFACPLVAIGVRRDSSMFEGQAGGGISASPITAALTRWILPRPLIVAPNEGFSGFVRLSPNMAPYQRQGTVTLTMVARGRRLPTGTPVPRTRAIPYASGWFFTLANRPQPDLVIRNVFPVDLHVTSINAAAMAQQTVFSSPMPFLPGAVSIQGPGGLANTVIRGVVSPPPIAIATGGTMAAIFAGRGAIEEAHDLLPGESYQIALTNIAGLVVNPATAIDLVGWREE